MKFKKIFLITLAITALTSNTAALSQRVMENSENWQITSAWVKEATSEQQSHAIFSAFTALNKKTAELVQQRQDGEQLLWVAKIIACGTSMLEKVSTKNPEIQNYLHQVSDLHVSFIRGEKRGDQFGHRDDQLRREGISIFGKINSKAYKETTILFKNRLSETDRSLVAYAIICATPKSAQPN